MKMGKTVVVNLCRLLLAAVFTFSGFVKAVDPMGTQYKLHDYLVAMHLESLATDTILIVAAVGLAALEFTLGICLLFAIQRRLVTRISLFLMALMTPLTLWLAIANPISDCGCFGDAVHLSNWMTFWKNVVLSACAVIVALWPLRMMRLISQTNQWIVVQYTILFVFFLSGFCLYYLPVFDFRPYHIGANIPEAMQVPEGAELPAYATTFVMEKDGHRQEFTLEDYPDSTWTFIEARTVQTRQGYVPPIHDLSMEDDEGEDRTEEILHADGYTFLLIAPHLETASDRHFGDIEQLHEYALTHHYPFYALTASGIEARADWSDRTGAEYQFLTTDETTLKTMVRSNPGLMLLHNGTVVGKWSHNDLPVVGTEQFSDSLDRQPFVHHATASTLRKATTILLWYVVPLLLLTLADRAWAWTKWVRRKKKKQQIDSQPADQQ